MKPWPKEEKKRGVPLKVITVKAPIKLLRELKENLPFGVTITDVVLVGIERATEHYKKTTKKPKRKKPKVKKPKRRTR